MHQPYDSWLVEAKKPVLSVGMTALLPYLTCFRKMSCRRAAAASSSPLLPGAGA